LLDETAIDCGADPAAVVAAWRRLRPDILQGYPSALRLLAHHCLQSGAPLSPPPRRVFSDSELLTPDTRRLVERAFGVAPIDVFGTFETDNIAYQCGQGGGYHIAEDCVVLEVVRDGRPVPDGEDGELVATVLGNHRSPLIRYALGDLGRRARESCRCGRAFPLLEVVSGRADDRIVLPGGQLQPALHLIGPLDAFAAVLLRFQIRQRDPRHFELSLVPAPGFSSADRAAIEACIRARINGASLIVRIVDRIALTGAGKLRCFVSDLQAAAHA
jgi:phenylacetate-CoA ligase